MKILMTGGTGLIGQQLGQVLSELGHQLVVISRNKQNAIESLSYEATVLEWDLNKSALEEQHFTGIEAVINLAGESIDGRWTEAKKKQILNSRVMGVRHLLIHCPDHVHTIIGASAHGYYGDRADELLNEQSGPGSGFLADVCQAWEAEYGLHAKSQRKIFLRTGIVLSRKGGALKKLVELFQKNLGAPLSDGRQWMSYISLDDLIRIIVEGLQNKKYSGVFNAVNGHPISNKDFTSILTKSLNVLQLPAVPGPVLKTLLGEMSSLVLSSLRVESTHLKQLDFKFHNSHLETFLENELAPYQNNCSLFQTEQFIPHDINKVFNFFADPYNLEKITPPLLNFKIEKSTTELTEQGTLIDYKLKIHGVPVKWRTLIDKWNPPFEFVDTQLKGPYSYWHHTHTFKVVMGGTLMIDVVRYRMPLGLFGRLFAGSLVESDVRSIFNFRRRIITQTHF